MTETIVLIVVAIVLMPTILMMAAKAVTYGIMSVLQKFKDNENGEK